MKRKLCMALSALMMVSGMAGFGIVAGASDGDVTLRYGIWDDNQKAALREIADKFEEENPGIKVEIEVTPWKDYWTTLETSATGGSAPDVFWMNAPHFAMYAMHRAACLQALTMQSVILRLLPRQISRRAW